MDLPQDLLVDIITTTEDFPSINAFARTCKRYAGIVDRHKISIADNFARTRPEKTPPDDLDHYIESIISSLPNGVMHGISRVCDGDGELVYRAEYTLGRVGHYYSRDRYHHWLRIGSYFSVVCDGDEHSASYCYVAARTATHLIHIPITKLPYVAVKIFTLDADSTAIYKNQEHIFIERRPLVGFLVDDNIGDTVEKWAEEHFEKVWQQRPDLCSDILPPMLNLSPDVAKVIARCCPGIISAR